MSDLKSIAAQIKQEHEGSVQKEEIETTNEEILDESFDDSALEEFEREESESVINDDDDYNEEDDETVVIGASSNTEEKEDASSEEDIDSELSEEELFDEEFTITDEELRNDMPDLDEEALKDATGRIRQDIDSYRKNLIMQNGFTIAEANEAAKNRAQKLSKEENAAYLEENPKVGVITIDKTNEKNVEFTPEEREKMSKTKVLRLKVVEDAELKNIPIQRVDRKNKSAILQSMEVNLSQYSVPLPLMCDYVQFKGSQIIQLIQAVRYNDTTPAELIAKKANLIYNQLSGGANLQKYDENGKVIMSYNDFINKFMFGDMDMALYGILVASSMEDIESSLTCGSCDNSFAWKYNMKRLLNFDDLNDNFKATFDDILGNKSDTTYLQKMYAKQHVTQRVQSPITQNIYDLNHPTINRAMQVFRSVDEEDELMMYMSALALYVDKMHIYNRKTGQFVELDQKDYNNPTEFYRDVIEIISRIPQEEIDLLQEYLRPWLYAPRFVLNSKCPSCGHRMKNELAIDDLVFLRARDSSMETQL